MVIKTISFRREKQFKYKNARLIDFRELLIFLSFYVKPTQKYMDLVLNFRHYDSKLCGLRFFLLKSFHQRISLIFSNFKNVQTFLIFVHDLQIKSKPLTVFNPPASYYQRGSTWHLYVTNARPPLTIHFMYRDYRGNSPVRQRVFPRTLP